jgi:hypothetical protein
MFSVRNIFPINKKLKLKYILKFSSYRAENTPHLDYKNQPAKYCLEK